MADKTKNIRVLIVDDDHDIVDLLKNRLNHDGYATGVAYSGVEALGRYLLACVDKPYDLIVLDIMMPKATGLEALVAIRKDERAKGIEKINGVKIVILTADKQRYIEAFDYGCDDYCMKPYSPEDLMRKIVSLVG
ncbi:MAG: two-component system alkaline phosphatase synthesis response regulator PhoP [Candidatus Omnitrophota bacterium]|jgi:two-component system alkaline phosphatase synthesis response regulator PhoP